MTVEPKSILFLDAHNKVIDWVRTLNSLKKLFIERSYTESHCLNSLLRILQKYDESSYDCYRDCEDVNFIANDLIQSQLKLDKKIFYRNEISKLVRDPSDTLRKVMIRLRGLASLVYDRNDDHDGNFKKVMETGLVSFVSDDFATSLKALMEKSAVMGREFDWESHMTRIQTLEIQRNIKIPHPLAYGRIIGDKSISLYNTTFSGEEDFEAFYEPKAKPVSSKSGKFRYNYDAEKIRPNFNMPTPIPAEVIDDHPPPLPIPQAPPQGAAPPPANADPNEVVEAYYVHPVQVRSKDRSYPSNVRGRSPYRRGQTPPRDSRPRFENRSRSRERSFSQNRYQNFGSQDRSRSQNRQPNFNNRPYSRERYPPRNFDRSNSRSRYENNERRYRSPSAGNRYNNFSGRYGSPKPTNYRRNNYSPAAGSGNRYRSSASPYRSNGHERDNRSRERYQGRFPSRERSQSRFTNHRSSENNGQSNRYQGYDSRNMQKSENKSSFRDKDFPYKKRFESRSSSRDRFQNNYRSRNSYGSRSNSRDRFDNYRSKNSYGSRSNSRDGFKSNYRAKVSQSRSPSRDKFDKKRLDGTQKYPSRNRDSFSPRINSIHAESSNDDTPLTNKSNIGATLIELGNTLVNTSK